MILCSPGLIQLPSFCHPPSTHVHRQNALAHLKRDVYTTYSITECYHGVNECPRDSIHRLGVHSTGKILASGFPRVDSSRSTSVRTVNRIRIKSCKFCYFRQLKQAGRIIMLELSRLRFILKCSFSRGRDRRRDAARGIRYELRNKENCAF